MSADIEKLDRAIESFDNVTSHVNEIINDLGQKLCDAQAILNEVSDIKTNVEMMKNDFNAISNDNKNDIIGSIKDGTQSVHDNIDDLRNNFAKKSEDNKNDIIKTTLENINYSKNETVDRINDGMNQINDAISLFKSSNELKQNEIQKSITSNIDNAENTLLKNIANGKNELLEANEKNKKEMLEETLKSIENSKNHMIECMRSYFNTIGNIIQENDKAINERMDKRDKRDLIFFISNIILSSAIFITLIVLFAELV